MHFIYVMSAIDKDKMLDLGYSLIKGSEKGHIWVFKNKDVSTFASEDEVANAGISFVLSDVLTF